MDAVEPGRAVEIRVDDDGRPVLMERRLTCCGAVLAPLMQTAGSAGCVSAPVGAGVGADAPWERFDVECDGARLACRALGAGSPLVMIHGLCCDSEFFMRAGALLARRHRVVVYDRRGYGASAGGRVSYPSREEFCRRQAADAAAVLRAVGEPCDVYAHSVGGLISLWLAEAAPELVRTLVVHEPPLPELLAADDPAHDVIREVMALRERSLNRAYLYFSREQSPQDPRAPHPTEAELVGFDRDVATSMGVEYGCIYTPGAQAGARIPVPSGVHVLVARSEGSAGRSIAACASAYAELSGFPLVYLPGAHNAARDVPASFAASIEGVLALGL